MTITVQKWGNSLGLRIPSVFAKDFSLKNGSSVEIIKEKEKIVILPKKNTLEQIMSFVNQENLHSSIETDNPVGGEEW